MQERIAVNCQLSTVNCQLFNGLLNLADNQIRVQFRVNLHNQLQPVFSAIAKFGRRQHYHPITR